MVSTHVLFETTKYELHTPPVDGWTKNQDFKMQVCMFNTIETHCSVWVKLWVIISILRSPIYRWSMKLIFGGFEEDMSTKHPPSMKVILAIEMELSTFHFFTRSMGLSYKRWSLKSHHSESARSRLGFYPELKNETSNRLRSFNSPWHPIRSLLPAILSINGHLEVFLK